MKWFKHRTDAHRGRSMDKLFEEMGHAGPACYWTLLELCAEKLEKKPDEDLTEADCKFNFPQRVVRLAFRLSPARVQQWLDLSSTLGLLEFNSSSTDVEISIPQLLEILEYDQKKSRAKSASIAPEKRLEEDKDKEEDKEQDKDTESSGGVKSPAPAAAEILPLVTKPNSDRGANREVWDAYRQAYLARYQVEPVRNARVSTNIAQFVARVGAQDAPDIATFYVGHNDSFYVRQMHTFGLCLKDAESLRTQWLKGRAITATDVRRFEQRQQQIDLLAAIERGECDAASNDAV